MNCTAFICLLVSASFILISPAGLAGWQYKYSAPTSLTLSAVSSATGPSNTVWAAVGERGTILVPPPSELVGREGTPFWVLAESGTEAWLRDLKSASNQWCAVGDSGTILRSTTLTTWTQVGDPVAADWVSVVRSGRDWVTVSSRGRVARANSTLTVDLLPSIAADRAFITCLEFGNGRYIAAGGDGAMFSSTDLTTWTSQPIRTTDTVSKLLFAEGKWFAIAGTTLWISKDGQSFTPSSFGTPNPMSSLHYVPSAVGRPASWMAAGYNGTTLWSTNLTTWTSLPSRQLAVDLTDIRYDNGTWVTVGNRGATWVAGAGSPELVVPSNYLKFWNNGGIPQANTNRGVFVDILSLSEQSGVALAVGSPGKQLRLVGNRIAGLEDTGITDWISSLRFASGQYVAVGDGGGIYTSLDSLDWNAVLPTYTHDQANKGYVNTSAHLAGVDGRNGIWVSVGERGTLLRSEDAGKTWSRINTRLAEGLCGVRVNSGGTWIAVGENQAILRSIDTLNWVSTHYTPTTNTISITNLHPFPPYWEVCDTSTPNGGTRYREHIFGRALRSVDYGNGLWVAVGDAGVIISSADDGATWTTGDSGVAETLRAVRYSPEGWIAAGDDGVTLFSSDASGWHSQLRSTRASITSLAIQDTNWIAGGIGGVILSQSRNLRPAATQSYRLELFVQYNASTPGYEAILVWPRTIEAIVLASDELVGGDFRTTHAAQTASSANYQTARLPIDSTRPRFFRLQQSTP